MANEWCRENDYNDNSDKHTAATLAAALIARGFALPATDNAATAADHAVDLYCTVLSKLSGPERIRGERIYARGQAASAGKQEEMDTLGVTRVDSAKFCFGEYRYDNLSDALRYARARSGAT